MIILCKKPTKGEVGGHKIQKMGRRRLWMPLSYDLSVGSTETKYIKLKTKTQNNIVIFGIFLKKWYYYLGFFSKQFD